MTRDELSVLADKYQIKADTAYISYQETGLARYDRERCRNEDLAEALRMAADAADDHKTLISLRVDIAKIMRHAQDVLDMPDSEERNGLLVLIARQIIAVGTMYDIKTKIS